MEIKLNPMLLCTFNRVVPASPGWALMKRGLDLALTLTATSEAITAAAATAGGGDDRGQKEARFRLGRLPLGRLPLGPPPHPLPVPSPSPVGLGVWGVKGGMRWGRWGWRGKGPGSGTLGQGEGLGEGLGEGNLDEETHKCYQLVTHQPVYVSQPYLT